MKKHLIILLLIVVNGPSFSQSLNEKGGVAVVEATDEKIYSGVDIAPQFPGGMQKFYGYVANNFMVPEDLESPGTIFVSFVVEKDGSLTDIKVLRDLGHGTAEQTKALMEKSPKWTPGTQNGKAVRVQYSLPIKIMVDDDKVYENPEIKADYPGTLKAFYKELQGKFRVPKRFHGNGEIVAEFIVEKDGSISGLEIKKDNMGGDAAKQVTEMLLNGPSWKPATQGDMPVRSRYVFPVKIVVE
ncbi:energy transducer TonB [Flavobacterium magnum]|nr:energy transducer TonB [Flavobacterium magnum]